MTTNTFTDFVGELAFAQLWQVTLVIAGAALLTRFVCRDRAHLAHLVWLVVLIKCLTPPIWSSPTGVFSWTLHRSVVAAKSAAPIASSGLTARDETTANLIDQGPAMTGRPAAADRPAASEGPSTSPVAVIEQGPIGSAGASRQFVRLLLLAWAAGAAVYATFAILLAVGSWRAVRRSRCPDDQSATAHLVRLAQRLKVRRSVRLVLVNEPLGPMTFGWIRPAIIVPRQLIAGRSPAELEPLLAHELIHVRRGDALVGMVQLAAQCVWWFHPLVWWANREIGRERERCCDEEVMAGLACPPATYARSLLNVLELKRQLRWLGPLPGLRPFEVTKQRLERLMTHSADFRTRMPRAYWLLLLAGVLVFVPGGRLARSTDQPPATSTKSNASVVPSEPTRPAIPSPGTPDVAAAAIVKQVYDSFGWIDQAHSFRIRTEYKIRPTAEALAWDQKHPMKIFGGVPHLDPRTFYVDSEWAWDQGHIRYAYQNHYEGETLFGRQTRVWDGSLAVEFGERSDHAHRGYVLDNKSSLMFSEQLVTHQLLLPWGPGGPHNFWWLPTDVARFREGSGLAPEDFIRVGEESVDGRPCRMVETLIGGYRLHVGIADGRLYRRTWLLAFGESRNADQSLAFQKVAGPAVKTYAQYQAWIKSLSPAERAHAGHRLMTVLAERSPPKRAKFQQTFADYREVAPGRWLPFRQSVENFSFKGPQPFVEAHIEQRITEVHVDTQLPKDLFHVELEDGVHVGTDWRYEPPIHYTFRKDQTEAERIALRDVERKKWEKNSQDWERRRTLVNLRVGSAPPPLPQTGWQNSEPLSWDKLRGKVVVLHFWSVTCQPCEGDLPFLVQWHRERATNNIVVIGIHPPTNNLAAVRKKLTAFNARYPVLVDTPSDNPKGIGLLHDWFGDTWWPNTVVIDKQGLIAAHGQVYMGDIPGKVRQLAAAEPRSGEIALRDAEQQNRAKRNYIDRMIGKRTEPTTPNQSMLAQTQPGNGADTGPTRKTVAPDSRKSSRFPRLIESIPKAGQSDVSAELKEIRVTFDRDMQKGMSWTGSPESFYPPTGQSGKAHWINARTCILPVKLEKGKYYRVGINSTGYQNFRSASGVAFPPFVIYFTTEGASAEERNRLRVPKIVELKPANGANDVDSSLTELRVTFDIPMDEGMSWTGGGPSFPGRPRSRAQWSADHKTCVLPVSLRPGQSYRLGLNSVSYNNFQSESGVPLEPVVYRFKTR